MNKQFGIVTVVGFALSMAACGTDNVAACKDYVQTITDCGGAQAAIYTDSWCEAYDSVDCDISDYFDCLNDAMGECTSGDFSNVDAMAVAACATKATCN